MRAYSNETDIWKIPVQAVLFIILLLPFFKPLSFALFIQVGYAPLFWTLISRFYTGVEIIFATLGYLLFVRNLQNGKIMLDTVSLCLIFHMTGIILSCTLTHTLEIKILKETYCSIGFIFLCLWMFCRSQKHFLAAGTAVFGFLSIIGAISIYLCPDGILDSATRFTEIYALGAKNNSFPFFFAYIFFLTFRRLFQQKSLSPGTIFLLIVLIIAGRICDSANTTICLCVVVLIYLQQMAKIGSGGNPLLMLLTFCAAITAIYMGLQNWIFARMLFQFDRSFTFSGRVILWRQALRYFTAHPLFGAGNNVNYTLSRYITTGHAHSQYLNRLAKYGFIPFAFLATAIILLFWKLSVHPDRKRANLMGAMLMVYMIHMSFDTYNFNFFFIFALTVNGFVNQETGIILKKRKHEQRSSEVSRSVFIMYDKKRYEGGILS